MKTKFTIFGALALNCAALAANVRAYGPNPETIDK